MLEGSNFRKPTNLFVHGYVTVNGAKMSKSRGTFIKASTWLNHFDADSLRYYYTANSLRALMISISTWRISFSA